MVVGFYNNKGGVGKSSLCSHAGFKAIEKGIKLCVCDADRQMNTISWLSGHNWNEEPYENGSVYVTYDLDDIDKYDMTLIDFPPAFEIIQNVECDIWIIPVDGRFSIDGALNVISQIRMKSKSNARIIVVANKAIATKFGKHELKEISKLDVELFKFPIPTGDVVRKAEVSGIPCWKIPYASRSMTTQNIELFSDWVVKGCNTNGVYLPVESRNDFSFRSSI